MTLEDPRTAVARLVERLSPVSTESIALEQSGGRVLAAAISSDRPSPAADVTAMDGYAVRTEDATGELPISAEVTIGQAPPPMEPGTAMRIFTGGAVPAGADAVLKREDVEERAASIFIGPDVFVEAGLHVRYKGENLPQGHQVVDAGVEIDATVVAALATFGATEPTVHRRVHVGTIATGDEVLAPSETPTDFQLRDSNTSAVSVLAGSKPWVDLVASERRVDNRDLLTKTLGELVDRCDAVFLTGGVSMGDYDFVPDVIADIGGEIVFHRLRQKPGKPLLGAIGPSGQTILGLPGNPVSVMVTARRWGLQALRKLAGLREVDPPAPAVLLTNDDGESIDLWWHRLVTIDRGGGASLVPTMGSGDLVSAARSDGFVVLPPGESGPGPWPFYRWDPS
ncbi:MAG: molybdopterin molybdotransferase MoeA [Acidimicrobiia bacterium]|nr:molybdopterin molybdotransferase MoeA [Acidimicrobiia bacterium]